ncbi:MFS general substrate transporter [Thozetella sp. PMI_491]|nr:MFS general substrate transporter [Thozetella sp. PMI_491]
MSTEESPRVEDTHDDKRLEAGSDEAPPYRASEVSSLNAEDILALKDIDPALDMKMHLVNNAIDEIGWTGYHTKLFFLNGFGYAVDSLILLLQSVIAGPAFKEFGSVGFAKGLTIAVYVGMLAGAIFWGLSADIIGRRYAFNISLFICSAAAIIAGAVPNWASLGTMIAILGFGGGGNLVLDTTVFLEYLPGDKQWLVTLLACWWGLGQACTGFIAWGFLVPEQWNCADAADCTHDNNMGWRYTMYTGGAAVFVMSVARITVIRLLETPKYLLALGEDEKVIETLQSIATKYGKTCSLTVEALTACGVVRTTHSASRFSIGETLIHFRGLFATKRMGLSTILIWLSWAMMGLTYPLFYVFLPTYLKNHGSTASDITPYIQWRDYALANISSVFGPILAGYMCNTKLLGRRYTMTIGALLTMAFFFAYTAVRSEPQDVGFSCTIAFCLNIYYGTLYAYTPEVLPSAHRATGNGVAVACNRIMGIMSAIIATYADTETPAPLYICAVLLLVMGIMSAFFPYEPYGKRSS